MSQYLILIESSTQICSIGLLENDRVIHLLESEAPNVHTERMTVMIQQVLAAAGIKAWDLDAVAVSDGPGSYTSLRVGLSVAKGLCYTIQKPLITIPSLDILAFGVQSSVIRNDGVIIPMIDARRNEVYAARYNALRHPLTPPLSIILDENWFDDLPEDDSKVILCGNGAEKASQFFRDRGYVLAFSETSARFMCNPALIKFRQQDFSDVAYHTPYYHKAPNITQSSKKLF